MAVPIILPDELEANTSLDELQAWTGVSDAVWTAVNTRLGMAGNLRVFALVPAEAFTEAVFTARVIIPAQGAPGEEGYILASDRDLAGSFAQGPLCTKCFGGKK